MSATHYVRILFLVVFANESFCAIDPPKIRCIALDSANGVTITWDIPADTGSEFTNYTVYYKPGFSGAYTAIAQVNIYNQNSIHIPGSFAGSGSFYVRTFSNSGGVVGNSSDTVSPIILSIFASNREVELQWTALNLESLDSTYLIYRKMEDGPWILHGQTNFNVLTFYDTINLCSAEVTYRIEVAGVGGCFSVSNFAQKLIADLEPPIQTDIACASVDSATGDVRFQWFPSMSGDVQGYLLYHFGLFVKSDTAYVKDSLTQIVNDSLTHTFSRNGINALIRPETLSVAPFDSCLNQASKWYNQAADADRISTVFLDTFSFDRCAGKLVLTWNTPKPGFPVGVKYLSQFRVYKKVGSAPEKRIATVGSTDSVYIDSGLVYGETYTYRIAAVDIANGKEAFSNPFKMLVIPPRAPLYLYISSIKNDHQSGLNNIVLRTDTTGKVQEYVLERAYSEGGPFQAIEKSQELDSDRFIIVDNSGSADQTDYYYRLVAYDYCGAVIATSDEVKSIYVDGFKNEQDYVNELRWTDYVGFESQGGVAGDYSLVRQVNDDSLSIIFEDASTFNFLDDVVDLTYINGRICYYVSIPQKQANQYGVADTSISNLFCLNYSPRLYIPNAFTPDGDGINDVFLPDLNYLNPAQYSLRIFDRYGEIIYTGSDPSVGWDGIDFKIGIYTYLMQITNAGGEVIALNGKVALIR